MKYLVFDSLITGHHLEYIHHIYDNCNDSDTFIFVIPEDFAELKKTYVWQTKDNVIIDMIPKKSCQETIILLFIHLFYVNY